jgi:hypothetical protein
MAHTVHFSATGQAAMRLPRQAQGLLDFIVALQVQEENGRSWGETEGRHTVGG